MKVGTRGPLDGTGRGTDLAVENSDVIALIQAPVSERYRETLRGLLGVAPASIEVRALRQLGVWGALRAMRQIAPARLVIPVEDANALHTLPVLQMLAAVTRARSLLVSTPEGQLCAFTRWSLVPQALAFGASAVLNACSALRARWRLRALRAQPLIRGMLGPAHRVLYVNGNLWFGVKAGGSIGHVAGVVNGLVRRAYHIRYASCSPGPLLAASVGYVPLQPQRVLSVPLELNGYRYNARMVRQLRRHLSANPADFIYQRLSLSNFAGVELSRRFGVPLVTEYNGSEVWAQQHWGRPLDYAALATRAEEVMLRHSHLVVTISEVLRLELVGRGVPAERIVMYPNCIDPAVFDPARFASPETSALKARLGIPADALVATFVGTFGRWHGVDVLARAIRSLLEQDVAFLDSSRLHFLLVGDGMKMAEVRAILEHPLAVKYVTIAGLVPQHEAPLYLAASDLLLSPHVENPDGSPFFGSPTKLFEYMAMGKPIIASDLDQIGEVLRHSVRVGQLPDDPPPSSDSHVAVLCQPGNPADIIAALHFLAANPGWRASLGRSARAVALDGYTWDRHVAEILAGMDRVLQKTTAQPPALLVHQDEAG
jgi:glycosyltransferase involved in cell wall biosynthesis